jgi:hypothetical protein
MQEYVALAPNSTQIVVDGTLGLSLVYRINRVFTPAGVVDLSRSRYFFSKETGQVVSLKGKHSKATPLTTDKYNKYTFREQGTAGFTRPFKVDRDEVLHAASRLL